MDDLIFVDRGDGPTVLGLMTAVLSHWDDIPLSIQAAVIEKASRSAFDSVGRTDGRYVVTAFVLRHRAVLARRRREQDTFGVKVRDALDRMAEAPRRAVAAATRWPMSKWLASLRRAA